jgi:hypothetical protein
MSCTPTSLGFSSPKHEAISQLGFSPDVCAEDPTHVLVKSYPADDEGVVQQLFELFMLAKAAKDNGVWSIGPRNLACSLARLDYLVITSCCCCE